MKKLVAIIFLTLITTGLIKAQHPNAILHFLLTDFETNWPDHGFGGWLTDSINPWVIDTTNVENIWQIGKPQKILFDSAYSTPYALVTDTINPYPINNHSYFHYNIQKPVNQEDRYWSSIIMMIDYKIDTDTLVDGGFIDISYDGGSTFTNIVYDNYFNVDINNNIYSDSDTLLGGIPGISGNSNGWVLADIQWFWPPENWQMIDSAIIRFNFISDSINTSKEGWMIDNIYFLLEDYHGIGVDEVNSSVKSSISPHPIFDVSYLNFQNDRKESYTFEIYNLFGAKVKVENNITTDQILIHKSDLPEGMYIYKLYNTKGIYYSGKLIIN